MDEPLIADTADAGTAHKIGRKSPRIEVITRADRRRTDVVTSKLLASVADGGYRVYHLNSEDPLPVYFDRHGSRR
jgi:hypothetical protein